MASRAPASVALRLGIEGDDEIKSRLSGIADSGDKSAKRLADSYERAGEDIEKAMQRRADAAAKIVAITPKTNFQAAQDAAVGTGFSNPAGSAQASAQAFVKELANLDRQAEALRATIDPLYSAQKRYDAELATASDLLAKGAISEREYAAAVALSTTALDNSRRAQEKPIASIGPDADAHVKSFLAAMRDQEQQAEALKNAIDPLRAAQTAYDKEIEVARTLLAGGKITHEEYAAAVRLSGQNLADAKRRLEEHAGAMGLNRTQTMIAQSAGMRFIDMLIAGQSPIRAFALESHKLGEVLAFDDDGVAGGLAKVRALLSPTNVAIGATTALVALGAYAWYSYSAAIAKLNAVAQGSGAVLGLTGTQLEATAEAAARAGNMTVDAAREIETGFLKIAKSGDVLVGLTAITKDFAAATGRDAKDAAGELATMFADPAAGADELAAKMGLLTQAQVEHIQKLVEAGQLEAAQKELLADLGSAVKGAADQVTGLAAAWDQVKGAASSFFSFVGKQANEIGPGLLFDLTGIPLAGTFGPDPKPKPAGNGNAASNQRAAAASALAQSYAGDDALRALKVKQAQLRTALDDPAAMAGLRQAGTLDATRTALDAYTHAVTTYLSPAAKKVAMDEAEAAAARARTPAEKQAAAAARERAQLSGQVVSTAQAEAQAHARGSAALATASKAGESHAATLARQADAEIANAKAALVAAGAYLTSSAAGQDAEDRQKAITEATKKGISVDEEVARQRALSVANAIRDGNKQTAQMRDETAARERVIAAVVAGTLGADQMNDALADEKSLRPFVIAQTRAQADQLDAATAALKAHKKALDDDHASAEKYAALAAISAANDNSAKSRDQMAFAGDRTDAGQLELARRQAERDAAQRYNHLAANDPVRTGFVDAQVDQVRTQLAADRAKYLADGLNSQRDALRYSQGELATLGMGNDERQLALDKLKAVIDLQAHNVDLTSKEAIQRLQLVEEQDQITFAIQRSSAAMDEVRSFTGGLVDKLAEGKLRAGDLLQEFIKLAAINPLKNLITGGSAPTLSSVFGSLGKIFGGVSGLGGSPISLSSGWGVDLGSVSKIDPSLFATPGFAGGTDYAPGGLAWVAENGPELIRLPRGASVTPAAQTKALQAANDSGGLSIQVIKGDLFDVIVQRTALGVAAPLADNAAARGAAGGAAMASADNKAIARRRLGRSW